MIDTQGFKENNQNLMPPKGGLVGIHKGFFIYSGALKSVDLCRHALYTNSSIQQAGNLEGRSLFTKDCFKNWKSTKSCCEKGPGLATETYEHYRVSFNYGQLIFLHKLFSKYENVPCIEAMFLITLHRWTWCFCWGWIGPEIADCGGAGFLL